MLVCSEILITAERMQQVVFVHRVAIRLHTDDTTDHRRR
jgi:hypothetical protein